MVGAVLVTLSLLIVLSTQQRFIPDIPKQCEYQGFCDAVPNYPYDYVQKLIQQLDETGYRWMQAGQLTFKNPNSNDGSLTNLCKSRSENITIQAAKHRSGKWYFVVEKHKVTIEVCDLTTDDEFPLCGEYLRPNIDIKMHPGIEARCEQHYIEDIRLTLDEN